MKSINKNISLPIVLLITAVIFIAIFCALFMLPVSVNENNSIDFQTALFTSVSSFTLNGASIVNNATTWSQIGCIFILIETQISALFIMILLAVIIIKSGESIIIRRNKFENISFQPSNKSFLPRLSLYMIIYTFVFEILGSVMYAATFIPAYGFARGLFISFFTAVSAFTNCGISILPNEASVLISSNVMFSFTTLVLTVFGIIGAVIIADMINQSYSNWKKNTKFVLISVLICIVFFGLLTAILEWNGELFDGMSWYQKLFNSLCIYPCAKTANINMLNTTAFSAQTAVLYILMMSLGNAYASTGSSIGYQSVFLFGKYIINTLIKKTDNNNAQYKNATTIIALSILSVFIFTVLLSFFEDTSLGIIAFQIVSAFFSSGTALKELSSFSIVGKYILTFVMLLGRYGIIYLLYHLKIRGVSEREILLKESDNELYI